MKTTKQSRPAASLPLDLATLPGMSFDRLREIWPKHMGRAPPPAKKRTLVRALAWSLQERVYGGLDAETRKLLNAAVRAVTNEARDDPGPSRPAQRALRPKCAALPPSTRLVRTWGGTRHEVAVVCGSGGGKSQATVYAYQGKQYKSLSEIARLITGTRWSGPRFFGLTGTSKEVSPQ